MVRYFGIPISVIYNSEPRYTNYFWQSLQKLLSSCAFATSAHNPQADGQTECMNCTICQILQIYLLDKDQDHWPYYIAEIEIAISSIINASI